MLSARNLFLSRSNISAQYISSAALTGILTLSVCLRLAYTRWLQNCQLINWQHRLALMRVSISCQKHLHEINSRWRCVSPISLRRGCYKDHLHDRWDGDTSTCRDHAWYSQKNLNEISFSVRIQKTYIRSCVFVAAFSIFFCTIAIGSVYIERCEAHELLFP